MKELFLAIQKGQPISLKTYSLPINIERVLDEVVDKILLKYQKLDLKNVLSLFVKEITGNAKKANLKRIFFKRKGLDINNYSDYQKGMEFFREEISDRIEEYNELLEKMQLFIHITFQFSHEGLIITIINNASIIPEEMDRIREKYNNAINYQAPEDAFCGVVDQTEGAGLGIIMIVLMLKKAGINPANFHINSKDGITVSRLAISFSKINEEALNEITAEIYAQIDKLPTFPSSIERIVDLIHDKSSDINSIARAVKMDPSLTMDILKLSNSAQFMLPKRVATIEEAIKIVGLSGLELMLSGYGAKKILDKNFGEMESIWEHSFKCAFYAQEIAKNRRLDRKGIEDSYLGGLMHDLGRFVIASLKKDMIDKISAVSAEKKLNIEILEDLTLGITHAKVGSILAKKWNFPEILVEVIELHHEPLFATDINAPVVYTVYFANLLCNIETGERKIEDIDDFILEFFNLSDKNLIQKIISRLNHLYKEKMKRFSK